MLFLLKRLEKVVFSENFGWNFNFNSVDTLSVVMRMRNHGSARPTCCLLKPRRITVEPQSSQESASSARHDLQNYPKTTEPSTYLQFKNPCSVSSI